MLHSTVRSHRSTFYANALSNTSDIQRLLTYVKRTVGKPQGWGRQGSDHDEKHGLALQPSLPQSRCDAMHSRPLILQATALPDAAHKAGPTFQYVVSHEF